MCNMTVYQLLTQQFSHTRSALFLSDHDKSRHHNDKRAKTHVGAGQTVQERACPEPADHIQQNLEGKRIDDPHPSGQAGFLFPDDQKHRDDIQKIDREEHKARRNHIAEESAKTDPCVRELLRRHKSPFPRTLSEKDSASQNISSMFRFRSGS